MAEIIQATDIRTAAVLGAGTMGHGIAQVAAMTGIGVWLRDVDQGYVDRAVERIRGNLDKGVAKGKVTDAARAEALGRIRTTTDVQEAVSTADVVIEAAPEDLEIKQAIFREVDRAAPAHALLATNTSSLAVARIADALGDPGRLVGMHFFNPVHIMKLVEIVRHEANSDHTVALCRGLAERIGKTPIVVRDVPGFASSRLGIAIGLEAMRMVEEQVATPADSTAWPLLAAKSMPL